MLYVLKRGVKKEPFELHILYHDIGIKYIFVYRVLLMFI